ncbi:MAG TPA: hypothetical protein DCP92_10810 [Nitrospiraceae bacterium]|jgi:hypothetical protein|nr:hypothetical protein [Nitrospiraceae bacterium]
MAFTGDLEHLHVVDIIQLLNTARKSGTLSVKGKNGESRIIFSNGYIVGASHLGRVHIGTVLVKMNAITIEDLKQALQLQRSAGVNCKPLIATLIELGKLGQDEASRGLKKLIEMTLVELVGWTTGTFTLDTEATEVSPGCSYLISEMEQEIRFDAQMILMDALRIFDERERDRQSGKPVTIDEELFADVISSEELVEPMENGEKSSALTADDLGLGDLDLLERKIPEFLPIDEIFYPADFHRRKIKEILFDCSAEEQEDFVSFLEKSMARRDVHGARSQREEGRAKGLILFSEDELIKHSVMTICKDEGVLVFTTDGEEEVDRIINQCLEIKVIPILVFDSPEKKDGLLSREKIVSMRLQVKERYPQVSTVQLASLLDYTSMLQSFHDGVRAVFPKPSREPRTTTFIADTMTFLEAFKAYVTGFFREQQELSATDNQLSKLKSRFLDLRDIHEPPVVSLALLRYVSEIFERSITFIVRPADLIGERAIGVYAERHAGPTSATKLKIPLTESSVFRDVIEKGQIFYGESNDEVLKKHLLDAIGAPLRPTILLLPMKSRGKTVTLTYADFGGKETSPIHSDLLEILATESSLVLENALYRKQFNKTSYK